MPLSMSEESGLMPRLRAGTGLAQQKLAILRLATLKKESGTHSAIALPACLLDTASLAQRTEKERCCGDAGRIA